MVLTTTLKYHLWRAIPIHYESWIDQSSHVTSLFDYQNSWDGVANIGAQKGKKVTAGTYYYVLSAKNSGEVKKGYIILLSTSYKLITWTKNTEIGKIISISGNIY
ncbi:MAG: gliding motility-associated C-terminal domain-containing protein [Prevotellaceae bacterium]|nr:gliding motility-associated C-terminal domain-containing protein [Prevotellaceae bacterium]